MVSGVVLTGRVWDDLEILVCVRQPMQTPIMEFVPRSTEAGELPSSIHFMDTNVTVY